MPPENVASAALGYAAQGLAIFPCNPTNKRPLTPHGFKDASTDTDTVRGWWARWPNAMIGMPTGQTSGVWVLDVDDVPLFAESRRNLPPTRRVMTGKGFHLHWRYDPAQPVRNAQRNEKTGWPFLDMPGAEVRGEGGYVILPPSLHPSGRAYAWETECEPASAPAGLLRTVTRQDDKSNDDALKATFKAAVDQEPPADTPYGLAALERECAAIRAADDGEQESTLNQSCLKIGGLVAGGELSLAVARRELTTAGKAMPSYIADDPWTGEAIAAKVDRALADGGQRSRSAPDAPPKAEKARSPITATPYGWPDPVSLPTRQWLLGHWLLRGEVTTIIAPGGSGKSTIGVGIALSLASGHSPFDLPLPRGPQSVWIYNLEDSQDELNRQVSAACLFHGIGPVDCENRLCVDSGLAQPLCTARETKEGFAIAEHVFEQIAATIRARNISVISVDPFVSSHMVTENRNEAIDAIAKRWKRLAQDTGCAVVLVHHTKKLGGREVTAEDGRGAVSLRDAARVVLTLNPMNGNEADALGISDPAVRQALIRVDTGKANRAPAGAATWIKLESQSLGNGSMTEPDDYVGVATLWKKPDLFHGLTLWHLQQVQLLVAAGEWRDNVQAKDWVGHAVAQATGLSAEQDKARIKFLLNTWKRNGSLAVDKRSDHKGELRPFVVVGRPVDASQCRPPHPEKCGGAGAESGTGDP